MGSLNKNLILSIFAAVLGMFQFGFNTGVINAPQASIEKFINSSYAERGNQLSADTVSLLFSFAVCSCLVGGMIGSFFAGAVADRFGRKTGLLYVQAFSIAGAASMGFSEMAGSYEMIFIGRFLIGLACGFFTGLVPLYISEIAPVDIRGQIGVVNQLGVTTGILVSQILGLEVVLGSETNWPLLLAIGGLPAIVQVVLLPMLPESPRYLVLTKGDEGEGRKALQYLRAREDIEDDLENIRSEESEKDGAEEQDVSIKGLLTDKSLRLPLVICVCMHLSQQLSGMVGIFYYSTTFFIGAGVDPENAQYATLGVGAILVTMTLVTMPLMDRLGRRTLHFVGLAGIIFFSILITIALSLEESDWVGVFLIVSTLSFVVFFALGPGSIPWLITGELFKTGPRPAATSIATLVNWLANLAVGLLFPIMNDKIGDVSFVPFIICTTILLVFLFVYLPETKGQSVEDIAEMLGQPDAWNAKYNRSGNRGRIDPM